MTARPVSMWRPGGENIFICLLLVDQGARGYCQRRLKALLRSQALDFDCLLFLMKDSYVSVMYMSRARGQCGGIAQLIAILRIGPPFRGRFGLLSRELRGFFELEIESKIAVNAFLELKERSIRRGTTALKVR